MTSAGLVVLLLATAEAAPPRVATLVQAVGLDAEDVERLHHRVDEQVEGTGAVPRALTQALQVKPECLDDMTCAAVVLRAVDAPWLLAVEALRAGGKVQIDTRLVAADGRLVAQGSDVVGIDTLDSGPLVPAELLAKLGAMRPVNKPPVAPPKKIAPPLPAEGPALPPLALAGGVAIGSGILVTGVSAALLAWQLSVLQDPASLGRDRETAAAVVPVAGVAAVAGALVATGGAVLLVFALE